uniref:Uncharacterized protein n=1 Tax=Arion vulgaris TaxID=1028688 RepID=A0A0B7B973_9EUPU
MTCQNVTSIIRLTACHDSCQNHTIHTISESHMTRQDNSPLTSISPDILNQDILADSHEDKMNTQNKPQVVFKNNLSISSYYSADGEHQSRFTN